MYTLARRYLPSRVRALRVQQLVDMRWIKQRMENVCLLLILEPNYKDNPSSSALIQNMFTDHLRTAAREEKGPYHLGPPNRWSDDTPRGLHNDESCRRTTTRSLLPHNRRTLYYVIVIRTCQFTYIQVQQTRQIPTIRRSHPHGPPAPEWYQQPG